MENIRSPRSPEESETNFTELQKKAALSVQCRRDFREAIKLASEGRIEFDDEDENLTSQETTLENIAQLQARAGFVDDAHKTADAIDDNLRRIETYYKIAHEQVAKGMPSPKAFEPVLKELGDYYDREMAFEVYGELVQSEVDTGLFQEARETVQNELANRSDLHALEACEYIVSAEVQSGQNANETLTMARQLVSNMEVELQKELDEKRRKPGDSSWYIAEVYKTLATVEAAAGDWNGADSTLGKIDSDWQKAEALAKMGVISAEQGHNPRGLFERAKNLVRDWDNDTCLRYIAQAQVKAGLLDDARTTANELHGFGSDVDKKDILRLIDENAPRPISQKEPDFRIQENIEKRRQFAIEHSTDDFERANRLANIAVDEAKHGIPEKVIQSASKDDIKKWIENSSTDGAYNLAFLRPDIIEHVSLLGTISDSKMMALRLGAAERQESVDLVKSAARSVDEKTAYAEQRVFARGLANQDYETASNILLGKINKEENNKTVMRYLKTLIEIENPKGRTLATRLYCDDKLDQRYKEYLAKKLIDAGHWDKRLGPYFENQLAQGKAKKEIGQVLTALIGDIGLNPDIDSYQALEAPGLLSGNTLAERVKEIKTHEADFQNLEHRELIERLNSNENIAKLYYLLNGGMYHYTLINDYSYKKFRQMVADISKQEFSQQIFDDFGESLEAAGVSQAAAKEIMDHMQRGQPPLSSPERTVSFNSQVEFNSTYEKILERLNDVWNQELKALFTSALANKLPDNMTDALNKMRDETTPLDSAAGGIKQVSMILGLGKKQDRNSIKNIAETCRKELLQSAKQQRNKQLGNELKQLPPSKVISRYVERKLTTLQGSAVLQEWESHLAETLTEIETASGSNKKLSVENLDLELTFLDKGTDFIRALRFADGQRCCFNSSEHENGEGTEKWVARLNADPLSFVMDLKKRDSNIISGFVFGRMGKDPESQKPVVMLNGVYSQYKGKAVVDNILKIVEERFASHIRAERIVIASQYGGKLPEAPSGYRKVKEVQLIAMRALQLSDGFPQEEVYDDIGEVANGEFSFDGYEKKLK